MDAAEAPVAAGDALADFYCLAHERFAQASRQVSEVSRAYHLGGHTLRLRIAGPGLAARLTPAFDHLPASVDEAPALTIHLWETASTGVSMPAPPWEWAGVYRGEVVWPRPSRCRVAYSAESGAVSLFHAESRSALYWVRDAQHIPYYECGSPLLAILHWHLETQGLQLAHAGAVGRPGGGVLLAGKGGSGKSTTALACLASEALQYAADDYCVVSAGAQPHAYSLYNTGKLAAESQRRLPELAAVISNQQSLASEKALYYFYPRFSKRLSAGFPLRAILLPTITGQPESSLTPVSAGAALRALGPSTLFQLAGAGGGSFRLLARLARQLPCWRLQLGTNIQAVPGLIAGLLRDLS